MIVLCYFELHYIVQFFDSCDFVLYYTHTHTHTHTYIYIYIYIYIYRERERERERVSPTFVSNLMMAKSKVAETCSLCGYLSYTYNTVVL